MQMQSIGADPEIFVRNPGGITSVIGHLGGTKYDPRMIDGFGLQEDNVLAEFSMPPVPAHMGPNQFSQTVLAGINKVNSQLAVRGLSTMKGSSHRFTAEELKSFGPKAMEFGCDPDRNAYTGDWNPAPSADSTIRTAGGHIHIGVHKRFTGDDTISRIICKSMDLYLGVPSVILDPDTERRELYGKAGAYRNKPYGIEYRTLSNFWIHSEQLRQWAYRFTSIAAEKADTANFLVQYFGEQMIQDCINESNVDLANEIVQKLKINLPKGVNNAQAA